MYRILHLSDLHLSTSSFRIQDLLNPFGGKGQRIDVISRLVTSVKSLRPDLIAVTGDLTDLGDTESFDMAKKFLDKLQTDSGAQQVICVPGNHDLYDARFLTFVPLPWRDKMANYRDSIQPENGTPDPGNPVIVKTLWGRIAIFLFNSCHRKLRDQGQIGDDQLAALHGYIQGIDQDDDEDEVRVALLHHHPVSAPSVDLGFQQQMILMRDGTRFIENLKYARFRVLMHGHQHVPFYSASWIETKRRHDHVSLLHVLAGGSATVVGGQAPSFNVVDVLSPFEAYFRRFDLDVGVTREFVEVEAERRKLQLYDSSLSLADLKGNGEVATDLAENPRDAAATNLRSVMPVGIDDEHRYDFIEFQAKIDQANHHYYGSRRLVGSVVADESDGWKIVLVGEPDVTLEDLQLNAIDNITEEAFPSQNIVPIVDEPRRKVLRLITTVPLKRDETFDITFKFRWPTTLNDPNDYDGFNLLYYKHQVGKIRYQAELPWQPGQLKLWACGAKIRQQTVEWEWEEPICAFELAEPVHSTYVVQIGENPL